MPTTCRVSCSRRLPSRGTRRVRGWQKSRAVFGSFARQKKILIVYFSSRNSACSEKQRQNGDNIVLRYCITGTIGRVSRRVHVVVQCRRTFAFVTKPILNASRIEIGRGNRRDGRQMQSHDYRMLGIENRIKRH